MSRWRQHPIARPCPKPDAVEVDEAIVDAVLDETDRLRRELATAIAERDLARSPDRVAAALDTVADDLVVYLQDTGDDHWTTGEVVNELRRRAAELRGAERPS